MDVWFLSAQLFVRYIFDNECIFRCLIFNFEHQKCRPWKISTHVVYIESILISSNMCYVCMCTIHIMCLCVYCECGHEGACTLPKFSKQIHFEKSETLQKVLVSLTHLMKLVYSFMNIANESSGSNFCRLIQNIA